MEVTSNLEAVGFYKKIGFVADGPADTRFGPAVRMHIEIGATQMSARSPLSL
jgi:hypothetical protein